MTTPAELLSPDDVSPTDVQGRRRALAVLPHLRSRGPAVPRALGSLGLSDEQLARHIAWDIGAAGVARRLRGLGRRGRVTEVLPPGDRLQPPAGRRRLDRSQSEGPHPREPRASVPRRRSAGPGDVSPLSRRDPQRPGPRAAAGPDGPGGDAQLHARLPGRGAPVARRRALQPRCARGRAPPAGAPRRRRSRRRRQRALRRQRPDRLLDRQSRRAARAPARRARDPAGPHRRRRGQERLGSTPRAAPARRHQAVLGSDHTTSR